MIGTHGSRPKRNQGGYQSKLKLPHCSFRQCKSDFSNQKTDMISGIAWAIYFGM